ncbi:hypothetical protein BSK66_26805 [Paenibacillus odorifer]|uniref:hypothetical protein n=1 Tax=Paenibacillus TaxID=44249 RepID=UPI0003E26A44|nr:MULTISPECIES: hypothetical protein [Paenibacillus]ETT49361.1 hypothetical protein C171_23850 [Paenibacillus sp. FSL H8-237]OME49571.1 hypothetical protein BSK66_26805 [Paenibacillus odorifer]
MGFTIDWGTLVVSIPVVATATVGAVKYLVKAYSKEHFDKRMEAFKAELQKEADKRKLEMEKEHTEYLKKLDSKMKVSADYIEKRYEKIQEIRTLLQEKYLTVKSVSPADPVLTSYIEQDIINCLEINRMYFTNEFIDLIQNLIRQIAEAKEHKYATYAIRDSTRLTDARKLEIHEQSSKSLKKLEELYHSIEQHLRDDYLQAI